MQKTQEELAKEFVNEVIGTDYMDGVFYFLEQQKYDLITSYYIDENGNEACASKLAMIGNGILTLISLPGNELRFYFGAFSWEENNPFIGFTDNAEFACEDIGLDENSIAFEYLKEALEHKDVLEVHLLRLMGYFNAYTEYFLECSGDVLPGTYELTDRGLEEQFKKFITFLDTRVVPKLQFESEQEI